MPGHTEPFIKGFEIIWDRIGENSYIRGIGAIASTEELAFPRPVTIFMGENGTGKSTLLEALAVACGFNPEGGTVNYNFSTYDSHSELHDAIRLHRGTRRAKGGYFLRAESFYNVATAEESYGEQTRRGSEYYHRRSHGESFLALAQNSFRPDGLYFLDEPEAALSPQRQLTLMIEIDRCVKGGAQFIMATHSPILAGMPGARILCFDTDGISPCEYEDTESYRVTKLFLDRREQLLEQMFGDNGEQ